MIRLKVINCLSKDANWPSGYGVRLEIGRSRFDSGWCCGDFSGLSHTNDLKFDIPLATLPGGWCYRVSAGTGWPGPGVSILWLGEIESLIYNFWLSVAAHKLFEQIHPWCYVAGTLINQQNKTTKQNFYQKCLKWKIVSDCSRYLAQLYPICLLTMTNLILMFSA